MFMGLDWSTEACKYLVRYVEIEVGSVGLAAARKAPMVRLFALAVSDGDFLPGHLQCVMHTSKLQQPADDSSFPVIFEAELLHL